MPPHRNADEIDVRHVVLVGLMGSGKSTVGRRLAKVLSADFIDTDERIEETSGRTIRDIFREDGEDRFRDLESRVLHETLSRTSLAVVASGGGIVVRPTNRELLSGHHVIWLRADPELLASRIGRHSRRGTGHRPLVDGDPLAKLTAMSVERRSHYEAVSTAIIDVDQLAPDDIVTRCADAIGRATP
jgi:shikimate kinase